MSSRFGKCAAAALFLYLLYFYGLTATGLLGPDEPRYASIGRAMAISGDWVTPRLWGSGWFEKPPLLYWMSGIAFRLGMGDDLAPRLPVAVSSVLFLVFFWWWLRREFGNTCAWYASSILATSAGWLAYSQVGTTDLPMSAAFATGMLLCLPWIVRGEKRFLPLAGVFFGLAVLGKGLVPLVLAAPLAWFAARRIRDWVAPSLTFLIVAAPWYVLCTVRNGGAFLDDFFLKHHFARFASESLQHVQPFWFYVPVFLAGFFPWTPCVAMLFRRQSWRDPARKLFVLWLAWGFVFFSASTNKLPGYLLPLLPAAAVLMALGLAESARPQRWLAASAAFLCAAPLVSKVLPDALEQGLSRAAVNPAALIWGLPVLAVAAAIPWLDRQKALLCVMALAVASYTYLKIGAFPPVDRNVSARFLWREIEPKRNDTCVEEIHRAWRYGLNYYSMEPLPSCADQPRAWRVSQLPGERPVVRRAEWLVIRPAEPAP